MRAFTYDPARSFRGWLRTLTRHAWCDFVEHRRRRGQASGDSRMIDMLESVQARDDLLQSLEEQFDSELLDQAMAAVQLRVAPRTWEAFRLLALDGWSGAQAAEQLGMKVAAVFMARSNVQKLLREEIHRLDRTDEEDET